MKLIVKTHKTEIVSDDRDILHNIDTRFAVPYPNYWFTKSYKNGTWDGKKHFFSIFTGKIPTGLLSHLIEFLKSKNVEFVVEDLRLPLKKVDPVYKLGSFDLLAPEYNFQGDAVDKSLEAGRGVLSIATNGGKTIIAAAIIKSLNLPTLFVVNGKDLLFQTYDVFSELLENVTMYGAGNKELGNITVAMAQSLVKLAKGKSALLKKYEIIFADECHAVPSNTFEAIFNKCPARYRFGLSGTAFDEHPVRDYRLMAVTGPIIVEIRNKELIERGVSATPTVYFLSSEGVLLDSKTSYPSAVNKGIVYNEDRNEQIIALIKKLQREGKKAILVLSPRKMHGLQLFNRIQEEGIDATFNHGSTSDYIRKTTLQEFRESGGLMLASTILDEGVDLPRMDALLLVGGGKKIRRLLQRVGRALRKKEGENVTSIYDFYDWQHKNLRKHSEIRLKTHLSEGFEVVPLDDDVENWIEKMKEKKAQEPKPRKRSVKFKRRNTLAERLKQLRKEKNNG